MEFPIRHRLNPPTSSNPAKSGSKIVLSHTLIRKKKLKIRPPQEKGSLMSYFLKKISIISGG
jgi:hypothetical protein